MGVAGDHSWLGAISSSNLLVSQSLINQSDGCELTFQVFRGDEAERHHEGDFLWEENPGYQTSDLRSAAD